MCRMMDGNEWSTDYTNRCGNCHSMLSEEDKYCCCCGTKRGEGKFEPYKNIMQCIYGPMPRKRVHECTLCNYTWDTMSMIDNQKFCPECGARVRTYEDGKEKKPLIIPGSPKMVTDSEHFTLPKKEVDYSNSTHSVRIVKTNEIIPLVETSTTIGRKEGNIIFIQRGCISRQHAIIEEIDDEYYLKDINSANGTLLNGTKLLPYEPVKLSNNDSILLAGVEELVFFENTDKNKHTSEREETILVNKQILEENVKIPKYIIAFKGVENRKVPYYCIEGTDQWIEAPKTIGGLYYDPVEDTSQYKEIIPIVELLVKKEMKSTSYELGACHQIWAFEKKLLKKHYGIDWHTPQELNPGCIFD